MYSKKIDAHTVQFSEINKYVSEKHIIPTLQRPYVWKDRKHVKKFLDDIKENKNHYFIGSLVFVNPTDGTIGREEIIDGQQRLITISLILISIKNIIKGLKMEGKPELKLILKQIEPLLRYREIYDDEEVIRLEFSDHKTNQFYKKFLKDANETPSTETQKNIKTNYNYINTELNNIFVNKKNIIIPEAVKFFEKIKTLLTISIKCNDHTIAYELFESINATALSLASVDLIKNYVFKQSKDHPQNLKKIENNWQKLEDPFSDDRSLLKTFLRHQWISDGQYISHSALYGAVETKHKDGKLDVGKYVENLQKDANIYLSLRRANVESLSLFNSARRYNIDKLKEVLQFLNFLNVDQIYAPILFFYKSSDKNNFIKYLNKLAAFQFLYKYIPGSPSSAEKIFADFSKIGKPGFDKGFSNLNKLVIKSDDTFKENFLEKVFYKGSDNGDIQFILERYVFSKKGSKAFSKPTIEHIISQKKNKDKIIQYIGNLTIFEEDINSTLPDEFKEKISIYKKSAYTEHHEIVKKYEFEKNIKKSINRRGEDVAEAVYDIFLEMLKTGKYK